jgi:hypothetical protein
MNLAFHSHVAFALLWSSAGRFTMSKRPISSFFQPTNNAAGKKTRVTAASGSDNDAATHDNAHRDSSIDSGKTQFTVFCDLDGVLVDFDAGVNKLLGKSPDQVPPSRLWPAIHGAPHFYRDLPWTADGEELWEALRSSPVTLNVLTGVSARGGIVQDKYEWCQRELCVETTLVDMTGPVGSKKHEPAHSNVRRKPGVVNVITCWSKNKHCESKRGQYVSERATSVSHHFPPRSNPVLSRIRCFHKILESQNA